MKLYTLGKLVERMQKAPGAIEKAIDQLGITATLELNGLRYYSVDDESRIDQAIRHRTAETILGRSIPKEPVA